jgi:hypothetical protein
MIAPQVKTTQILRIKQGTEIVIAEATILLLRPLGAKRRSQHAVGWDPMSGTHLNFSHFSYVLYFFHEVFLLFKRFHIVFE